MKFKLDEKYILAEKRHLVERYILAEGATAADSLTEIKNILEAKLSDTILDNLVKRFTSLNPAWDAAIKELNDKKKHLDDVLSSDDSLEKVRDAAKDYTSTLLVTFDKAHLDINKYPNIEKQIHEIDALNTDAATTTADRNKTRTTLNKTIKTLSDKASKILTTSTMGVDAESAATFKSTIDKFKANKQEYLNNISKVSSVLTDKNNTETLQPAVDTLNRAATFNSSTVKFNDAVSAFDTINTTLTGLLTFIDTTAKANQTAQDKANARKVSGKLDWAYYYDNCHSEVDFDKFWNGDTTITISDGDSAEVKKEKQAKQLGYYKAEWGDKADLVRSFGNAFIVELKTYGWDSINNPFIAYLKGTDANSNGPIINIFDFNQVNYRVLHNAVANDQLFRKDLLGIGEAEKLNIIFFKELWKLNDDTIENLIRLQRNLIKNWNNINQETKNIIGNIKTAVLNVFFNPGDVFKKAITDPSEVTSFRNPAEVRQIITQLVGDIDDKKITNAEIDNIVNNLSTTDCEKVLVYLVYMMSSKFRDLITKVDGETKPTGSLLKLAGTIRLSLDDMARFSDNVLRLNSVNYSKDQYEYLLVELAKKAGIYPKS